MMINAQESFKQYVLFAIKKCKINYNLKLILLKDSVQITGNENDFKLSNIKIYLFS